MDKPELLLREECLSRQLYKASPMFVAFYEPELQEILAQARKLEEANVLTLDGIDFSLIRFKLDQLRREIIDMLNPIEEIRQLVENAYYKLAAPPHSCKLCGAIVPHNARTDHLLDTHQVASEKLAQAVLSCFNKSADALF